MSRKVEILAPAGSNESIHAAIAAGADAVYVGGHRFGARAYADNLDEQMMCEAIDFVHLHGKKLYMTVNTLMKETEMRELYDYLAPYYERGLDAAIVQDLGVLHFLHREFPELALHASTQMTITSPYSAQMLKDCGVTRIVPARELSLHEIARLKKESGFEIECFVHGALCYCYSGQCLMSSFAGGRSGNRGRCAQPCRTEYQFETEDGSVRRTAYALSPKDICTIDEIPELIEAGIDSFKIEGRMKKPAYAGLTAHLYRKYADLYLSGGREGWERFQKEYADEVREDRLALMDLYNRGGFSEGYYKLYNGPQMMSTSRPNHSGVKVGTVTRIVGSEAEVRLFEDIYAQDVLEFRRNGAASYEFTRKDDAKAGAMIRARFLPGTKIVKGDVLYRTRRNELIDRIEKAWLSGDEKIAVQGTFIAKCGEPMRLTVCCEETCVTVEGETVQEAKNQPMTPEGTAATLKKTGEELFAFDSLSVEVSENAFQTVGNLKKLRRETFAKLKEAMLLAHQRKSLYNLNEIVSNQSHDCKAKSGILILEAQVEEPVQFEAALKAPFVSQLILSYEWEAADLLAAYQRGHAAGKTVKLAFSRICREREFASLEHDAVTHPEIFTEADGFLCPNLEVLAFLKKHDCFGKSMDHIAGDHSLYQWNHEARAFLAEAGLKHYTAPLELDRWELASNEIAGQTLVVYGRVPAMTSVQCLRKNMAGCTQVPEVMKLSDGHGRSYLAKNHCRFCYNEIFTNEPVWLGEMAEEVLALEPSGVRLVFTTEDARVTEEVLRAAEKTFAKGKPQKLSRTQTGHFERKVE